MQVCVPSTPAQIFHLIRRQLLRPLRRPLIVMSPKSLLRYRAAVSELKELTDGDFIAVYPDHEAIAADEADRLILCSGKVYYDLLAMRSKHKLNTVGLLRIEQLYPFPSMELAFELLRYKQLKHLVWCQEEPRNQGALYTTRHRINQVIRSLGIDLELQYAGRDSSAAPSTGYMALHKQQQQQLLVQALGISADVQSTVSTVDAAESNRT